MKKPCCKKFELESKIVRPVGNGGLYPVSVHPEAQIEYDEKDDTWNVNGCCGGGCYVLTGLKFCPFCGTKITKN